MNLLQQLLVLLTEHLPMVEISEPPVICLASSNQVVKISVSVS